MDAYIAQNIINSKIVVDKKRTAEKVKEGMKLLGKNVQEFAQLFSAPESDVHVNLQAVSYWCTGKNLMSDNNMKCFAAYLGVDIDDLIVFEGEPSRELMQKYERVNRNVSLDIDYIISAEKTGQYIESLMIKSGYSVRELAYIIGVSPTAVRTWKKGAMPCWGNLKKLSMLFGVKMNDIIKLNRDTVELERRMNVF